MADKKGWLREQFETVEQEVKNWPDWLKRALDLKGPYDYNIESACDDFKKQCEIFAEKLIRGADIEPSLAPKVRNEIVACLSGTILTVKHCLMLEKLCSDKVLELGMLFAHLEMLARYKLKNTSRSFQMEIMERSSSSEDGFFLYLAGGGVFEPGVYYVQDGAGGPNLKPSDKIGLVESPQQVAYSIFMEVGNSIDYVIADINQWIDNHKSDFPSEWFKL